MNETQTVEQRRGDPDTRPSPYGYYALLIGLYNALFGGFLLLYRRAHHPLERVTPLDLVMLGLSTLRMAKMVSEDEITTVIRQPLIEVEGDEKRPKGRGLRWSLGRLVLCPTCTGTWIAAFLSYALHISPRTTRPLLAMMSASAIEQLGDAVLSLVYTDRNVRRHEEALLEQQSE